MRRLLLFILICWPLLFSGTICNVVVGGVAAPAGLTCTHGSGDSAQYTHDGHGSSIGVSSTAWKSACFTISATTRFTSVDLWVSGGHDEMTVEIWNTSGNAPTSIADVNATRTVDPESDPAGVLSFDFATPFSLDSGTYAVVVKGSLGNNTVGYDAEAGCYYYTENSGSSWTEFATANLYMVVYGCQ